jgi:hypothetical protein
MTDRCDYVGHWKKELERRRTEFRFEEASADASRLDNELGFGCLAALSLASLQRKEFLGRNLHLWMPSPPL